MVGAEREIFGHFDPLSHRKNICKIIISNLMGEGVINNLTNLILRVFNGFVFLKRSSQNWHNFVN